MWGSSGRAGTCDHRLVNHGIRARAHEGVARLAGADLDLATLIDESIRLLDRALPHDAACWHTIDPATLVETSFRVQDMPRPDAKVAEFAYLSTDYNTFTGLARGSRHAGLLSQATGGKLDLSPRYRALLRPNDIQGELRTALVADGACWGCFAFFREAPHDFTEDERRFADELSALLGRGFRSAGVRARTAGGASSLWPGLLMFDEDRRVASATSPAAKWLEELGFRGELGQDVLPFAVVSVAERVRRDGDDVSARVLGESGEWVQVLGSPATDGRVAIILQGATPPSVAPLLSAAYGLTARERELTELVLHGCGTAEIAAQLFISPHTVQGHLKSIFTKTGVRSRRELVTRVFVPR